MDGQAGAGRQREQFLRRGNERRRGEPTQRVVRPLAARRGGEAAQFERARRGARKSEAKRGARDRRARRRAAGQRDGRLDERLPRGRRQRSLDLRNAAARRPLFSRGRGARPRGLGGHAGVASRGLEGQPRRGRRFVAVEFERRADGVDAQRARRSFRHGDRDAEEAPRLAARAHPNAVRLVPHRSRRGRGRPRIERHPPSPAAPGAAAMNVRGAPRGRRAFRPPAAVSSSRNGAAAVRLGAPPGRR